MLSSIMYECRNYFVKTVHKGCFAVRDGILSCKQTFLPNQYVRIMGSILNDGVYQADEAGKVVELSDEEFSGAVCGLAVPKEFLSLVDEITEFCEKQKKEDPTLISENFKGYSYTKATTAAGMTATWKEAFRTRLNGYRKMFEERI